MKLLNLPQVSIALAFCLHSALCSVTTLDLVEICSTSIGTVSKSSVGSTTAFLTVLETCTVISTSTPIVTISPAPKTTTSTTTKFLTSTKTVPNTSLNTFTSTTTIVGTVSITTVVATTTVTSTETDATTSTPTTTIPTSAGFVPASSAPLLKKRAAAPTPARSDLLAARRPNLQSKRALTSSQVFPESVTCGVLVEIISSSTKVATAPTATVHACTSTITRVSTVTSTIVSTNVSPAAPTTQTISSTIYVTSTIAATSTTTQVSTVSNTVIAPSATFYAACASNNLLSNDPYDGGNLCSAYAVDNTVQLNTDSAYDCCVACQQNSNCGGAFFDIAGGTCVIDQPSQACDPNYVGSIEISGCNDVPATFIGIDGNCGQVEGT
ncbi:MAG: hypothetical protein ASARMPRED_007105 [Alectoria sarmentosa]|nr:MAG: hypothetical protein ASARMPRED_007105 [Alectoria sarmentosa]